MAGPPHIMLCTVSPLTLFHGEVFLSWLPTPPGLLMHQGLLVLPRWSISCSFSHGKAFAHAVLWTALVSGARPVLHLRPVVSLHTSSTKLWRSHYLVNAHVTRQVADSLKERPHLFL